MSEIKLARAIDELFLVKKLYVTETVDHVALSEVSFTHTKNLLELINQARLVASIHDRDHSDWSEIELREEYAPFRIAFAKPQGSEDELFILTNTAFSAFLKNNQSARLWRVARFGATMRTEGCTYADWEQDVETPAPIAKKSPRSLVRETSGNRIVPATIAPWTLTDSSFALKSKAAIIWANYSISACIRSLADDIDSETGEIKFKGPPRLTLKLPERADKYFEDLGASAFSSLQQAVAWVFENDREAEVRHILFACEIARSSNPTDGELHLLGRNLQPAFEGAKIAYQMSIAEVGKDTLKSLADLRKSVTEDTSKVTESTRQVAAAVAGALALGFGLIAARTSTTTPHWLLVTVMVIVVLYVGTIIFAGFDFIRLQRSLRSEWQSRLYRFLPQSDYDVMVAVPTRHAERTFTWTAGIGGVVVILLACAVAFDLINPPGAESGSPQKTKAEHAKQSNNSAASTTK
ncbi:hypothetical protein [Pseudoduganella aquatica]|uniref:hypothetical protein n=1 Tax=Pseudoduganella aquatica TaxID=2660641 RepID=UPI001E2FB131|nr:hypothetical protein [Pseudoduganella aquatica]